MATKKAYSKTWQHRSGLPETQAVRPLTKAELKEIAVAFSAREARMALAPSTLVITRRVK